MRVVTESAEILGRLAAFLGLVFLLTSIARAADPTVDLSIGLMGGRDDQVLAGAVSSLPVQTDSVAPLVSGFGTLQGRLALRWAGIGRPSDRLEFSMEAAGTAYQRGIDGVESDLRSALSYRNRILSGGALEIAASYLRYRRPNLPLLDLDLPQARIRTDWMLGRSWLMSARAAHGWSAYPGRAIDAGVQLGTSGGLTQRDRQLEIAASLSHWMPRGDYIGLEAGWSRIASNDSLIESAGPLLRIWSSWNAPWATRVLLDGAYRVRSFEFYPVLTSGTLAGAPTELGAQPKLRGDHTKQLSLLVEHRLSRRTRVFVGTSLMDRSSNIPALAFRQTRLSAGIQVDLITRDPAEALHRSFPSPPSPMTPEITSKGVRFRFRAPHAHSVQLVGGFNAWREDRDPLRGPDRDGVWETTLTVPQGLWRYAFVVDNVWQRPQDAPLYEGDGFGGENGVLEVSGGAGPGTERLP